MNKTLLITILLGAAALAGVLYTTQANKSTSFLGASYKYQNEFKQFTTKFQKAYSVDEVHVRYNTFASNMEIINAQNTLFNAGQSTYFLGINKIADLTSTEIKAKYLGYRSQANKVRKVQAVTATVAVPAAVDWTTAGAVTGVKDQGQCGSCWAFSAIGSLEGLNFLTNGNLQSFSEQAVIDCSTSYGNQGCNGGIMDQAFQYTAVSGVAAESEYPYTGAGGTCQTFTSLFKNSAYTDVTANSDAALVAALAVQPVSIGIEADTSAFQLYAGGILNDTSCGTTLDHGVLAVGYESDFYKVKNSWGASWGEEGFIRLARTGDGPGMCGIQSNPSFPTA